jgi:flagellar motility protein MotE (MotC chaperone)
VVDDPKAEVSASAKQPEENKTQPKKKGLVKYILYATAGILLVAGAAAATLFIIGNNQTVPSHTSENAPNGSTSDQAAFGNAFLPPGFDSLAKETLDQSVAEMMKDNLSALNYDPDLGASGEGDSGMLSNDSLPSAEWIRNEKAALNKREAELNARQHELDLLEKKLSQALLRIEKEESTRTAELAKLYDKMEANAVAQLMANLDDETAVMILPKMKPQNASAVMQLLPPQRAAILSKRMITIAEQP